MALPRTVENDLSHSLNDYLLTGPNCVLMLFYGLGHTYPVALTGDIKDVVY